MALMVLVLLFILAPRCTEAVPIYDETGRIRVATVDNCSITVSQPVPSENYFWGIRIHRPKLTTTCTVRTIALPPEQPVRLACLVIVYPVLCADYQHGMWVPTDQPNHICTKLPPVGQTTRTTELLGRHPRCELASSIKAGTTFPVTPISPQVRFERP
jgi:hypothetical protein